MTYLVTAATGNIGAATLAALLARGQSVRAASRRAQYWPDGVEGVQADLNDPEAFTEAARDVGGAFVMAGYPSEAGLLAALPEDAHVVLLSSSAAPTGRLENAAARYHIVSERAVEASGRAWTMLQPNAFMSNALRWKPQLAAGDVVRAPFAEVAIACVDPADIGAVAATALVEGERHAARRYRLSGPEALEPAAQVAQLARVLGRPLRFEAIDETDTNKVIDQFNEAFRLRAPERLVDIIADDCVMEGVGPAPDGNRWTGYDECLAGWQGLIRDPGIRFEVEHVDVDGDRAVIRWRLHADAPFRGVNLMRIRDGKIVAALGYGKRP